MSAGRSATLRSAFITVRTWARLLRSPRRSLTIARVIGDAAVIAWNFILLGSIAAQRGNTLGALELVGPFEALRERTGFRLSGTEAELHEKTTEMLRNAVGQQRYEAALVAGRTMSIEEAVECARRTVSNLVEKLAEHARPVASETWAEGRAKPCEGATQYALHALTDSCVPAESG